MDKTHSLLVKPLSRSACSGLLILLFGVIAQLGCNKSSSPGDNNGTADVVGKRIEFKTGGNSEQYRVSGWSVTEPKFTWSEGTSAKLALQISPVASGLAVKVTMAALVNPPALPFQPVELYANGQKMAEWQVADVAEFVATIPGEITKAGGTVTLEFRTPKATSPKALGLNEDARVLGVCLTSLELAKTP
jgi:hypothetical protein